MICLLWTASTEVRYFLLRYLPISILLDPIRTRNGLKLAVPAMLLAAPYPGVAVWITTLIGPGAPGWLHLVVLVCIWNVLSMVVIGPVRVVLLVSARTKEGQARTRTERGVDTEVSQRELTRSNR